GNGVSLRARARRGQRQAEEHPERREPARLRRLCADEEDEERAESLEVPPLLVAASCPRVGAPHRTDARAEEPEERERPRETRVREEVDLEVPRPGEAVVLGAGDPLHRAVARADQRALAEELERGFVA